MDTVTLIILTAILLVIVFVWVTYNSLISLRNKVKEAWSDIDVQLKKRYDLLPDLVETARKATIVDEDILTKVTELRSSAMQSSVKNVAPEDRAKIENDISNAVHSIKVQVEAYPQIGSHAELMNLMDKTTEIEEKIAYSRRFYNQNVLNYNTKIEMFPNVIVANFFAFTNEHFFAATDQEREDIKVKL